MKALQGTRLVVGALLSAAVSAGAQPVGALAVGDQRGRAVDYETAGVGPGAALGFGPGAGGVVQPPDAGGDPERPSAVGKPTFAERLVAGTPAVPAGVPTGQQATSTGQPGAPASASAELGLVQVPTGHVDLFVALEVQAQGARSGSAAVRERLVEIDRELLEATRPNTSSTELRLNLFDDTVLNVVVDQAGLTSVGYWLSGNVVGDDLSDVTLVVNDDVIMGTVRALGATYAIRPAGNGVYSIYELDSVAVWHRDWHRDSENLGPPVATPPDSDRAHQRKTGPTPDAVPAEDGSRIDLLVVYTPAARDAQGGHNEIKTLIDLFVAETNRALAHSGAIPRFNLVHSQQVDYTQQPFDAGIGEESVIMDHLLNPSDGHMDEVHSIRDEYGADLVHLIVTEVGFPGCGEAKRLQPSDSRAAERYAFGVTRYNCPSGVFAHELGHALGLNHDRYAERHACCIVRHGREWNEPHPYSYGYVNQRAFEPGAPESSRWLTIMAYESQYLDAGYDWGDFHWLLRFSNPHLTHEGDPIGIPGTEPSSAVTGPSDARRTLNELGHVVANFRAPRVLANRPPESVGTLVPLTMGVDDAAVTVKLASAFRDPDGDALTYGATSTSAGVASVTVLGSTVTVAPVSAGTSAVHVTAADPGGLSATQSFTVTVEPPANQPPVAVGTLAPLTLHVGGTPMVVDVAHAFRDPDGDPLTYRVASSAPAVATAVVAGSQATLTPVSTGVMTVTVTATDTGGASAMQQFAVTVTVPVTFTDHPIRPGTTPIRAVHFRELRERIAALRTRWSLPAVGWTDPILTAGVTPVRLVHLLELRSALAEAYARAGRAAPRWSDTAPAAGTTPIRTAHLMELRAAVVELE